MTQEKRYCQNCGSELFGEFCSKCGQRDKEIHIPISDLATEFIDVIPSFDERLIRSIKPFLMKPGFLTLEYISGKRKSYISPFKMYLFISFVFFFISSFVDMNNVMGPSIVSVNTDSDSVKTKSDSAFVSVKNSNSGLRFSVKDSSEVEDVFGKSIISALKNLKENPQLLFDKIKEHRPKLIFILMPVFALILKLLYWRTKSLYIKHLVFSFYFHSFIFFMFLMTDLLRLTGIGFLNSASVIFYAVIPVNLYFGLKRVYHQSTWKTIAKLLIISTSYVFVFFVSVIISVFIIIYLFYL